MDDYQMDLGLYIPSYRLPCLSRRIAYGVGHILNDFGRTLWFNFLLIFLVAVVKLEHAHVGYIVLTGHFTGVLSSIIFDHVGSRKNACFCWYTRRKSWHLCGTILSVIGTLLLFMTCIHCSADASWLQSIYYAAMTMMFHIGWSAVQSSHLGMVPEITRNPNERIELGAVRYSFGVVANLVVFAVLWLLLSLSSGTSLGPNDAAWFRALAITLVVTGSLTSLVFHLGTDEHGYDMFLEAHLSSASFERMSWRQWLKHPQFYLIAAVHTFLRVSINLATMYLPFFLIYTLQMEKVYIAAIPFAAYLGRVFIPFATRPLSSCTSPKVTVIVGSLLVAGAGVWAYFLKPSLNFYEVQTVVLALVLGAGGAIACVSTLDIVGRILGDNTETGSFIYGTLASLEKLMTGIAVVFIQAFYKEVVKDILKNGNDYYRYIIMAAAGFAALALLVHLILVPMKLSILRNRAEMFSSASTSSQTENRNGESNMAQFEETSEEDCFNYWSCLSTSLETEAHYVAVTFTTTCPPRDRTLPSLGGSINAITGPYTASVFETNQRSHSYESIEALREAGTLRSVQSAPNIIEYSGNHERHHIKAASKRGVTTTKDTAQLLDHEEMPDSTSTPKLPRAAGSDRLNSTEAMVHPEPKEESGTFNVSDDQAVVGSPYDNVPESETLENGSIGDGSDDE